MLQVFDVGEHGLLPDHRSVHVAVKGHELLPRVCAPVLVEAANAQPDKGAYQSTHKADMPVRPAQQLLHQMQAVPPPNA